MDINNPVEGPLQITMKVLYSIRQHVFTCLPEEACGVFLGHTVNGIYQIDEYIPIRNTAADPIHHFSLDPAAWTSLLLKEPRICGLFHSHPASLPIPSWEDIRQLQSFGNLLQMYLIGSPNLHGPDEFLLEAYQIMKEPPLHRPSESGEGMKRWMLRPVDYILSCST